MHLEVNDLSFLPLSYCLVSRHRCQSGWSFIELLVVMTIIVILASIALPNMSNKTQPAYRQLMQAELLQLAQQLEESYRIELQYQQIEVTPFPQDDPRYKVLLTITQGGQYFVLEAKPLASQQDDGWLSLDASGSKRLYQSNSAGDSYVSW